MKIKNLLLILGLLLIASLALTACSGGVEETAAPDTPADDMGAEAPAEPMEKKKVVIFVGLGTGTDPDQIAAQEALAEEFNASRDDIEIEFLIVPHDEAPERLLAMISSDNPPDLVGPGGIDSAALYFDLWADVSPMIETDNFDMSDFYGAAVDLYDYPDKTLGLPLGMFPSFIYYNKDLFDAAGLDYPTTDYGDSSWNLDALREVAMQLTLDANGNNANSPDFDANAIAQYGFDDSWTDLRGFMLHFDPPGAGRPTTPDMKTALVNSDEYQYGLEWLNNAIWVDHFMADYTGQEAFYAVAGDPFGSELTAMFYSHTWFMAEGLVDLPFEYGFAAAPYTQKGTQISRINADTFYIPKNAKDPDASWSVLKWLTSSEHIIDVCLIYGCLPARQSVADAYTQRMIERYGEHDYDVVYTAIDYLDNPNFEGWMPAGARVGETLNAEIFDLVHTEPVDDAAALLDTVNENVQALLDEYWADQ